MREDYLPPKWVIRWGLRFFTMNHHFLLCTSAKRTSWKNSCNDMCNSQTHQVVQKKSVNSPSDSSKVGEHNLAVLVRHVLTWEVAEGGYEDSITDISQCFIYQRYMCIYTSYTHIPNMFIVSLNISLWKNYTVILTLTRSHRLSYQSSVISCGHFKKKSIAGYIT